MIEIVINFDNRVGLYKIYEPTTDTLMGSANLTEALFILNKFLTEGGMIKSDLLSSGEISYHLDSATMQEIIKGNVALLKQLKSGPSGFTRSSQKFGSSPQPRREEKGEYKSKSNKKGGAGGFQGATGFGNSARKFGF